MLPSQILQKHRSEIREIMERYPTLANLRVFGSVARGEDAENSDIDFLVDPLPGATYFDLGGLHEDLEDLLGVEVDVISSRGQMKAHMKMAINRDALPI